MSQNNKRSLTGKGNQNHSMVCVSTEGTSELSLSHGDIILQMSKLEPVKVVFMISKNLPPLAF